MIQHKLYLKAQKLQLPFRTSFRHASANRILGQSVWVCATLDGHSGFGEGCPRDYVTGEDLETCLNWTRTISRLVAEACNSLSSFWYRGKPPGGRSDLFHQTRANPELNCRLHDLTPAGVRPQVRPHSLVCLLRILPSMLRSGQSRDPIARIDFVIFWT